MSVSSVLATSSAAFPGFKLKTQISTLFLEHDKHVLLLQRCHREDQPGMWGIPGGKANIGENPMQAMQRELREETRIELASNKMTYHGKRYARIPNWDYIIHFYHAVLEERPQVLLEPKEHNAYEWVSIYAFKTLRLIKGQGEVFDLVYQDRLWQRVGPSTDSEALRADQVASIILRKGSKTLTFDADRRLIFNLIGTSGSGKGTQGDLLTKIFGVPNISAGDLFRDEFRARSKLGSMIEQYDRDHYPAYLPDEVPIGMMVKRLAEKDCSLGFILDGFPRTGKQGDATREVLLRKNDFHVPIFMDVPEEDIWARLPGRFICTDCGHQVREFDENPWPGHCPIDGAKGKMVKLEKRSEDVDKAKIERRLKMFRDNRNDINASMNARDNVASFQLNNSIPPREVLHRLSQHINIRLDELAEEESIGRRKKSPARNVSLVGAALIVFLIGLKIFNNTRVRL